MMKLLYLMIVIVLYKEMDMKFGWNKLMVDIFMRKTMKFILFGNLMDKNINHKSINGYSLMISLLCFFLLIQIISFTCIYTLESRQLLKANQQSMMDLSILSQAKHMIENNTWIRICHGQENDLIIDDTLEINNKSVHFHDYETYVEVSYGSIIYKIYYDDKYISNIEINS